MNMKKRAELPSVEVLFGKGEERQVIKAPKRKNVKALKREGVKTLEGAKERLSPSTFRKALDLDILLNHRYNWNQIGQQASD